MAPDRLPEHQRVQRRLTPHDATHLRRQDARQVAVPHINDPVRHVRRGLLAVAAADAADLAS
ncbi:hypothetical protein GCM10010176_082660 [Nonomuraea spiralis]|nr:hypothetical protein GCM10010176_082660 [Nonomuraea spiralis]